MKREESHVWVAAETGVEQGGAKPWWHLHEARFGYFLRGPKVQENQCLLSNLSCGAATKETNMLPIHA